MSASGDPGPSGVIFFGDRDDSAHTCRLTEKKGQRPSVELCERLKLENVHTTLARLALRHIRLVPAESACCVNLGQAGRETSLFEAFAELSVSRRVYGSHGTASRAAGASLQTPIVANIPKWDTLGSTPVKNDTMPTLGDSSVPPNARRRHDVSRGKERRC